VREEACTERAPAVPAFRHARQNWLAYSPVAWQVGRLLLRQNRINDPVIGISFTIQKQMRGSM